ncbi:MAG: hypothetical protein HQ546_03535 [Planctomycetes bacterium]|nr:hypothetical protein [Planctomycetota bacterium]
MRDRSVEHIPPVAFDAKGVEPPSASSDNVASAAGVCAFVAVGVPWFQTSI